MKGVHRGISSSFHNCLTLPIRDAKPRCPRPGSQPATTPPCLFGTRAPRARLGSAPIIETRGIRVTKGASVEAGWVAARCWSGLLVRWLSWWGRWMCENAPDDFVVADNVELPCPGTQGGMQWEWRVVSLKDIFPGELLALCVQDKDVGPEEDLGGWRGGDTNTESRAGHDHRGDKPEHGGNQPVGRGGGERCAEPPAAGGSARIPSAPLAFAVVEGCLGSERGGEHQGGEEVIDVNAKPPPPVSSHLFYPTPPHRGTEDGCGRVCFGKEEGSRPSKACGCGCPSSSFPPGRRWVRGPRNAYGAVSETCG